MELKNEHISVLRLTNLIVEDFSFRRNEAITEQEITVDFKRTIENPESHDFIRLKLSCSIGNEHTSFSLKVTLAGVFEIDIQNEEAKKRMLVDNATAIIFPFLRSQITLLTSQPNFTPLVLPPMNIAEMFNNEGVDVLE